MLALGLARRLWRKLKDAIRDRLNDAGRILDIKFDLVQRLHTLLIGSAPTGVMCQARTRGAV
jgi:hypothetical protein